MIQEALQRYAFFSHRPWDRTASVGASEIGQCARRVWYSKYEDTIGAARDRDRSGRWGARRCGDVIERHVWLPALQHTFGARLIWAGDEQRTLCSGTGHLSATPDGLLIDLPRNALAEFEIPDLINGDSSSDRSL